MTIAAVRAAAVPDVGEIVRIQAATWAFAYAELVPATAIERLRGPEARQAWTGAVAAGEGRHVLVASEGEQTVGFCAAAVVRPYPAGTGLDGPASGGPYPDGTTPRGLPPGGTGAPVLGLESWGEIGVLLVEPRWGRRGHGGRLLAAAAEALRAGGAQYGLAWVPEPDEASRCFYARVGWEPDGSVRGLDTGDGTLREIRVTGSLDLKLRG